MKKKYIYIFPHFVASVPERENAACYFVSRTSPFAQEKYTFGEMSSERATDAAKRKARYE